jgi:glyoxylase-like metal-dependent hydrolase (beta-lactamase superfamily II)
MGVAEYVPAFAGYLAHRGWARPARVLLTHRHKDHLGGVDHLRERYPGLPVAKMIHKDEGLPEGVADIRDGERVTGDGVTLVPVHTPGHASDHLCYYLPEERALFSGDLILNGSTSVIPDGDGDLGLYMDSLRRVQALEIDLICPGHGPFVTDPAAKIAEYLAHRLERERKLVAALDAGERSRARLLEAAWDDVPDELRGPAAQVMQAHLSKLESEGRLPSDLRD